MKPIENRIKLLEGDWKIQDDLLTNALIECGHKPSLLELRNMRNIRSRMTHFQGQLQNIGREFNLVQCLVTTPEAKYSMYLTNISLTDAELVARDEFETASEIVVLEIPVKQKVKLEYIKN